MKYKMIVSDFDGTLCRSDDTISKNVSNAIHDYINAGGNFIISTGRMRDSVIRRLPEINLSDVKMPVVSFQGALINDSVSGEVIYKVPMSKSEAVEAIETAEKNDFYVHCYDENFLYAEKECEFNAMYSKYSNITDKVKFVGKLSAFIQNNDIEVLKVTLINSRELMDDVLFTMNKAMSGKLIFVKAADVLIEAVDRKAGKGNTNNYIAKSLGISAQEVIAIGDSMNDHSMILAAALGVAVENASKELKAAAKYIAPSNDEDGVAFIIKKAMANELP